MFSLLPMREGKLSYILTILVKYTKPLSLSCADVYSRMFKPCF